MLSNLMVSVVATLISYAQPQAIQRNVELSIPQTECLTEAIYFESRSEGTEGGVAVSYVVLNRASLEGKTICDVVHEKSQFAFYKPNQRLRIEEADSWNRSAEIAVETQLGSVENPIGNATFYNTVPVRSWKHVVFVTKIKHHYFYQLPSTRNMSSLTPSVNTETVTYVQSTPIRLTHKIKKSIRENHLHKHRLKRSKNRHHKYHRKKASLPSHNNKRLITAQTTKQIVVAGNQQ